MQKIPEIEGVDMYHETTLVLNHETFTNVLKCRRHILPVIVSMSPDVILLK